jgi:hypothetical protein
MFHVKHGRTCTHRHTHGHDAGTPVPGQRGMIMITVTFEANGATSEDTARRFVDNLTRQAGDVGVRNLRFVSYTQPITFATQAELDRYVTERGGRV